MAITLFTPTRLTSWPIYGRASRFTNRTWRKISQRLDSITPIAWLHSIYYFCIYRYFLPPFIYHVAHIIKRSTKKKMVWVYARRNITFMTNVHTLRNIAVSFDPGQSVRADIFSIIKSRAIAPRRYGLMPNNTLTHINIIQGNSQ